MRVGGCAEDARAEGVGVVVVLLLVFGRGFFVLFGESDGGGCVVSAEETVFLSPGGVWCGCVPFVVRLRDVGTTETE